MKKLQNNFTTPEQSKRLLELGVPAESADTTITGHVHYDHSTHTNHNYWAHTMINFKGKPDMECYLPCWSVGRLIEICLKCSTLEQRHVRFFCNGDDDEYSLIDYVVTVLESGVITNHMDFSKLD